MSKNHSSRFLRLVDTAKATVPEFTVQQVRALGTPKEDLAGWTERFDAWMAATRASARVSRIAPQGSPEW